MVRILHCWSTQCSKFDKTPYFAENKFMELGIVFLQGVKCLIPQDSENHRWVIEKSNNESEDRLKLILTDMTTSKVYAQAAAKAAAEASGEQYVEPPLKKKAKTDDVCVPEVLKLTVDMGPKKSARNVLWLDDVRYMIHAAQDVAQMSGRMMAPESLQSAKDERAFSKHHSLALLVTSQCVSFVFRVLQLCLACLLCGNLCDCDVVS